MKYIAIPETIFNEIMRYLNTQPFEVMETFIPTIKASIRAVSEQPAPKMEPVAEMEVKENSNSSS